MFKPGTGMEKVKPLNKQAVGTAALRSPTNTRNEKFVMPPKLPKLETGDRPRLARVGPKQLIVKKKVHEVPKGGEMISLRGNKSDRTASTAADEDGSEFDGSDGDEDEDSMADEYIPMTPSSALGRRRKQGSGFLTLIVGKSRIRAGIKGAVFLLFLTCGFLLFYSKTIKKNAKVENVIAPPTSLMWNDDDTASFFAAGGFVASSLLAMSIGPLLRRCMNSQTSVKDSKARLTFVILVAYELMWAALIVQAVVPYPGDAEQSKSRCSAFVHLSAWACFVLCALIHANCTFTFYGNIDDGDDHFLAGRTGWGVAMFFFALIGGGSPFLLDRNSDNLKNLVGLSQYLFFFCLSCSLSYYYMDSSLLAAEKRDVGRVVAFPVRKRESNKASVRNIKPPEKESGESGYGASEKVEKVYAPFAPFAAQQEKLTSAEKNSTHSRNSASTTRTLMGPQLISIEGVKPVTGARHFSKLGTFTKLKSTKTEEVAVVPIAREPWDPYSGSREKQKVDSGDSGFQCVVEDNNSSQNSDTYSDADADSSSSSSEMELEPGARRLSPARTRGGMLSASGESQIISDES